MTALNRVTRYHLIMDAIHNARRTPSGSAELIAWCEDRLREHSR
jgi:xylulose-5-phosphate/fructose-6-phosphate phosphoketolase